MNKILLAVIFFFVACSGASCDATKGAIEADKTPLPAVAEIAVDAVVATAPSLPVAVTVAEPKDESRKNFSPMDSIKDLDKQIESYHLGQNLTSTQNDENLALKKRIIQGTFDIAELSRLSLGAHWGEIKPEQQKYFVDLMTRLLEKKAIFSKEQLHGDNKYYNIVYLKETFEAADQNKSVVTTRMMVPKRKMDLDLTYKLLKKSDDWKIYDVIVDDASLLSNYKFQFDRIIQKGGFSDLISRMETKLNKIGGGDE